MSAATGKRGAGRPLKSADAQAQGTRETILIAAARLFSQHGPQAVRLYEIAEASGLSTPALYYYFKDKSGILKALGDFSLKRTLSVTGMLIGSEDDPAVALYLSLWFHVSRSITARYDMWFQVQQGGVPDQFTNDYQSWRAALTLLHRRAQDAGTFRHMPEPVALNFIIGSIYGVKELYRVEGLAAPDAMAEFVIRGFATSEALAASVCAKSRERRGALEPLIASDADDEP